VEIAWFNGAAFAGSQRPSMNRKIKVKIIRKRFEFILKIISGFDECKLYREDLRPNPSSHFGR
jgi:hypothetical protein